MFAGLLVGLFIALLVYLKMLAPATPVPPGKATDSAVQQDSGDANQDTAPAPKPRFDFYTLLPEMEVVIPEQAITGETEAGVKQVDQPGTYLLQVGSFNGFAQADRLKAKLALLGFETDTQEVTINGKDTFYRVRVGPFSTLDDLNRARTKLRKEGHDAILIRIKD